MLFPFQVISQRLQHGSLEALTAEVQEYMNEADPQCYDRQTEFIVLFIKVDHNGSVIKIDLMGDENNRDSTYIILSKMPSKALRRWEADSLYRNKIIVLPVFSQGLSQNRNYLDEMNGFGILSFRQCGYNDSKLRFIISPQMTYYPKYYRPDLHNNSIKSAPQRKDN
jgi:hypothetical protein